MSLTMTNEMTRILLTDKTETGNAEVQPVRDSRPRATNCRRDGSIKLLSHFKEFNDNSELCNALKKPLCRRQSSLLTVKWICPFHAEPVQSDKHTITVGQFGRFVFNRGYYFYAGSAQRNMSASLERHSKKNKPFYWHIDYLSVKAKMLGAIVILGQRLHECKVACELGRMFELSVPGFGASDCRCAGHLFFSQQFF